MGWGNCETKDLPHLLVTDLAPAGSSSVVDGERRLKAKSGALWSVKGGEKRRNWQRRLRQGGQ